MQYYFNLRYPIVREYINVRYIFSAIVLFLDQGEIVKFVYNWLTGENGGGRPNQTRTISKKARTAPVFGGQTSTNWNWDTNWLLIQQVANVAV